MGVCPQFLEGFPGWRFRLAMPWPFITEACRALWCRWRHCKRSIDVGDGNYPAALLAEDFPWTFSLPSCCCKKRFFFFPVFSFVLLLLVCGFLQNLRCQASSYWRLIIYHLGKDSCIFLANSTTLRTVVTWIFLIFIRIPGEMLKFD